MLRAARIGTGLRDGRDLIQEPSRDDVLSALGPEAATGVGDLSLTLVGCGLGSRGSGEAEVCRGSLCAAAKLFTSPGDASFSARFPVW